MGEKIMKKLRVGIIGCGNIFPMHAYPVMEREDTELVAICDNKSDRMTEQANKLGASGYTDYIDMFDKADLDVVHLCTPHYLHPIMAIEALKRGIMVLTEKPMSIAAADAKAMVDTSIEFNTRLGVIFQNRYNPGSKLIKSSLENGSLGKIISGRAFVTWNRSDDYYALSDWKGTWDKEGGGVIIDQAIHTLDLMRWFVNDDIDFVDAHISNRAHEIIEVEDSAEGVIKYKNGVVTGFYTVNYYGYDAPVEIELYCENGIAKMVGDKATITMTDGTVFIADKNPNESFNYGDVKSYWGVSHVKQINQFYDSLRDGVSLDVTAEDACKTQEMVSAIYESGKTGKRINF